MARLRKYTRVRIVPVTVVLLEGLSGSVRRDITVTRRDAVARLLWVHDVLHGVVDGGLACRGNRRRLDDSPVYVISELNTAFHGPLEDKDGRKRTGFFGKRIRRFLE